MSVMCYSKNMVGAIVVNRWMLALTVILLAGCASQPPEEDVVIATETQVATPTPPTLAPTLPPITPTLNLAPTALPAPTQIEPPTAVPADATGTPGTAILEAGIRIEPALGEPGDIIIVEGRGFQPGAQIDLHWNPVGGPTGPVYLTVEADANGFFSVGIYVPAAEKWPGGAPKDRDIFQLRATSPTLGDRYFFANFTYLTRFQPQPTAAPPSETPTP